MVVQVNSISVFEYIFLLLLCIVCFFIYVYVKIFRRDPRHVAFAKTLFGPPTVPLIGNGFDFFWSGIEGVEKMLKYSEEYGNLYRLWFGKHLTVVISNAEDLQTVFLSTKMLDKPELCEPFSEFFGNSVFTETGQMWRRQRKRIQPLYTKKALPFYEESIVMISRRYVQKISDHHLNGSEFDLWEWIPFLIFDIVTTCRCDTTPGETTVPIPSFRKGLDKDRATKFPIFEKLVQIVDKRTKKTNFDIEFSAAEKRKLQYHLRIKKMAETMFLQSLRPWFHIKLFRLIANCLTGANYARGQAYKYAKEITRRKLMHPLKENTGVVNTNEEEWGDVLLSRFPFLSATSGLQEEYGNLKRIHDEIVTVSAAATDTTAITLSSFLLLVAMYPEIQNKLWNEIQELYGHEDRGPTVEDLERLPYLDLVLKETQRRFTPLPLIFRKVAEDCKIGEMNVPAGTTLAISLIGIHNNLKYYEDPLKFDPNRFMSEEMEKRPKLAYIPFSAGSRNCVGMNYALLIVKFAAVVFLRSFKLDTSEKLEDVKLAVGFISVSINGYKVRVTQRLPLHEKEI